MVAAAASSSAAVSLRRRELALASEESRMCLAPSPAWAMARARSARSGRLKRIGEAVKSFPGLLAIGLGPQQRLGDLGHGPVAGRHARQATSRALDQPMAPAMAIDTSDACRSTANDRNDGDAARAAVWRSKEGGSPARAPPSTSTVTAGSSKPT